MSKAPSWPENVAYAEDKGELYNYLIEKKEDSPFYKKKMATLFTYALAVGYQKHVPETPKNRKPYIPTDVFSEKEKWLIMAVAIAEKKDVAVLLDLNEVVRIAESYANAGIRQLAETISKEALGDPLSRMESDIRSALSKIKIEEPAASKVLQPYQSDNPMELIAKLEKALRDLIWDELANGTAEGISKTLPSNMAKDLTSKWIDKQKKATSSREVFLKEIPRLIDYSEFGELYQIIIHPEMWEKYFSKIFKNKVVFEGDMTQVMMIRPDEAHSRGLNRIQLNKLQNIVDHHLMLINTYHQK